MMNKFILNPSTQDIEDIALWIDANTLFEYSLAEKDVTTIMSGCKNALILEATASGEDKIHLALEELSRQAQLVVPEYNLFSAERLLLQMNFGYESEFTLREIEMSKVFLSQFRDNNCAKTGMARTATISGDSVRLRLVATNLNPT